MKLLRVGNTNEVAKNPLAGLYPAIERGFLATSFVLPTPYDLTVISEYNPGTVKQIGA